MGVKEKALTAASSIASGDFLRMVTSGGASRKIDYSKLAKAIVEEYNGSTIAGSAQTLKVALDSLNSKLESGQVANNGNLNEITNTGTYLLNGGRTYVNAPDNYGVLVVMRPLSAVNVAQLVVTATAIYFRYKDGNGWYPWKKLTGSST